MGWLLGIDTGGTFTDVVAVHEETGEWKATKIWSDPTAVAKMIGNAIVELGISPADVRSITYGTTQVTNALVEGRLAKVALVTSRGFKDFLEIARQKREPLYDMRPLHRPKPPVSKEHAFEVSQRRDHKGCQLVPLDKAEVQALVSNIPAECDAAAVVFLHSYADGSDEIEAGNLLRARFSRIALSHQISPEAREYERGLTTVLSAALLPLMQRFVASLIKESVVQIERFRFFHSAGGLVAPETAAKYPLLLAMSGPAAGVNAASRVAHSLGLNSVVSLDMGGTTTDCSLLIGGDTTLAGETRIGDHTIRQPMISLESIGAGGGSLVRLKDSRLSVGPESAGSNPGPACYGRGGECPTLTDAAALLGYFGSSKRSRALSIDTEAARKVFLSLANELNRTPEEVASGTIAIASAMAARAIKRVTMSKGIDARSCAMIAFGGAGPMFGTFIAQEVGMHKVVIPSQSSALSAAGCLLAEPSVTKQWTLRLTQAEATSDRIDRFAKEFAADLSDEVSKVDGASNSVCSFVGLLRYPGQSYEVEVPFKLPYSSDQLTANFRSVHQAAYGFVLDDPWEFVALRVTVAVPSGKRSFPSSQISGHSVEKLSPTKCFFDGQWLDTPQVDRANFVVGDSRQGPAIILDDLSTIVIPPGATARALEQNHIVVDREDYRQ